MSTDVRQAELADQAALGTFIERAYGALAIHKDPRRWNWQFVENPFRSPDGERVPVWIAVDGEDVVGQIAVQMATLQVGEDAFESGWIVDVMVLPSHRGQRLGHRLHAGAADGVPVLVTLTMAEATRRIAEKAGCITLGPVRQYSKLVRLDASAVQRYLMERTTYHPRIQSLARVACRGFQVHRWFPFLANPLIRLREALRRSRPSGTEIVEVDAFGEDIDELWERSRGDYPVIFPRNRRFLNWRFVECPELVYRKFVARRNGETVGYCVLRRCEPDELPLGVIVDLYASRRDHDTLEDLVRHAQAFFGRNVAALDCATSLPELEAIYRRLGFFATRTMRPTCVCRDDALRARLQELGGEWFFSKGDHDWDQIHLAWTPD